MDDSLKAKTKNGIYWSFVNQVALNGMQFVVGIIMARKLSASDYGITALPAVFIAIANVLVEAGFSTALIRKSEVTERDLSTVFYYSALVGVVCYILLYIGAPFIASFYNTPILVSLIRVTALTFLWSPLITPQNVILNRNLNFKTKAKISIVNKCISAIVGVSMAYLGYGLWSLVVTGIVSSLLDLIMLWYAVKWIPKTSWSRESFSYLWGFGNKMLLSNLMNTIHSNIMSVLVGKFYSPVDLGIYNRANGYARMPYDQISGIVQTVAYPVLCKTQTSEESVLSAYRKMLKTICFVTFPIMFMLIGLAKPLIIVLITEKWADSILLLQLLCLSVMWGPVSSMISIFFQVKGRSDILLNVNVKKKIVGLLIMCVFLPFGLTMFCVGNIFNQIYVICTNMLAVKKISGLSLFDQLRDIKFSYLISLSMCGMILTLNLLLDNYYLQLIVGFCIGTSYYFIMAHLLKMEELKAVKIMIYNKKNKICSNG